MTALRPNATDRRGLTQEIGARWLPAAVVVYPVGPAGAVSLPYELQHFANGHCRERNTFSGSAGPSAEPVLSLPKYSGHVRNLRYRVKGKFCAVSGARAFARGVGTWSKVRQTGCRKVARVYIDVVK